MSGSTAIDVPHSSFLRTRPAPLHRPSPTTASRSPATGSRPARRESPTVADPDTGADHAVVSHHPPARSALRPFHPGTPPAILSHLLRNTGGRSCEGRGW